MVEEVIKKIRLAEEEAEKIALSALEQATEMKTAVEVRCKEILSEAKAEAKCRSEQIVADARDIAEAEFAKAKRTAAAEREKLLKKTENKVNELAEEIYGRIVDGCC